MKKKVLSVLVITATILVHAVPCFAATSSSVKTKSSSSSSEASYTRLPDAETLKKDIGFVPKLANTLADEFQFKEGNITETFNYDENGAALNAQKGVSFSYTRTKNGSNQTISLSAGPAGNQTYSEKSSISKYGEYSLYSSEEQANSVAWVDHDISYILMDINKKVTIEELKTMAKELIDLKEEPKQK